MKLPMFVINWLLKLHEKAAMTPYFHLPGYMLRDWILGYRSPERNTENPQWSAMCSSPGGRLYRLICHHIAIRAHTILRSDQDRHLHDHPAWSVSVVLEGGYWEICEPTPCALENPYSYAQKLRLVAKGSILQDCEWINKYGIYWRGPGAVVFRKATAAHRLVLPNGAVTKSIFVMGKKSNSWGFYTEQGKVGRREYLADNKGAMQ